jgi:hypothetical protein
MWHWMYGALSLKYFCPTVTHLCQWVFAAESTSLDEHVGASAHLPSEVKNYRLCILWRILWGGGDTWVTSVLFLGTFAWSWKSACSLCRVCPSGRRFACFSTDFTRQISVGTSWKSDKKIQIWLKSGQKYQAFYNNTHVQFVFAGNLKLPYSCCLGMTWCQAVRI